MTEQEKANLKAVLDAADTEAENEPDRRVCLKIQAGVERARQLAEDQD